MQLHILVESLSIFKKYDKNMFYLIEDGLISVGQEELKEKMSVEDIGRLVRLGWTYDHDDELFYVRHKHERE